MYFGDNQSANETAVLESRITHCWSAFQESYEDKFANSSEEWMGWW
jgi:hypothetical protein